MFGLEKIFGKRTIEVKSGKKEETPQEYEEKRNQEYYEKNKEEIDEAAREIANKIIEKDREQPDTKARNRYLAKLYFNENELADRLRRDFILIKRSFIDRADAEKIRNQEIFPLLDATLRQDKEGKWTVMLSLDYRKVLAGNKRETINGGGISYGKSNIEDKREAQDWLSVRRNAIGEALEMFQGGWIEEGDGFKEVLSKE